MSKTDPLPKEVDDMIEALKENADTVKQYHLADDAIQFIAALTSDAFYGSEVSIDSRISVIDMTNEADVEAVFSGVMATLHEHILKVAETLKEASELVTSRKATEVGSASDTFMNTIDALSKMAGVAMSLAARYSYLLGRNLDSMGEGCIIVRATGTSSEVVDAIAEKFSDTIDVDNLDAEGRGPVMDSIDRQLMEVAKTGKIN